MATVKAEMANENQENNVKRPIRSRETEEISAVDQDLVDKSSWMIRPCSVYDAEQWECLRPRGRFYQWYINGEFTNCGQWLKLVKDCRKWMRSDDVAAGARIIRHEKELIERRIESRLQNDVWTHRKREERPPVNWNDPLPPHIAEKHENSYLREHENELLVPLDKSGKTSWFACSIL